MWQFAAYFAGLGGGLILVMGYFVLLANTNLDHPNPYLRAAARGQKRAARWGIQFGIALLVVALIFAILALIIR